MIINASTKTWSTAHSSALMKEQNSFYDSPLPERVFNLYNYFHPTLNKLYSQIIVLSWSTLPWSILTKERNPPTSIQSTLLYQYEKVLGYSQNSKAGKPELIERFLLVNALQCAVN